VDELVSAGTPVDDDTAARLKALVTRLPAARPGSFDATTASDEELFALLDRR
jgi:hypothetical protein